MKCILEFDRAHCCRMHGAEMQDFTLKEQEEGTVPCVMHRRMLAAVLI